MLANTSSKRSINSGTATIKTKTHKSWENGIDTLATVKKEKRLKK